MRNIKYGIAGRKWIDKFIYDSKLFHFVLYRTRMPFYEWHYRTNSVGSIFFYSPMYYKFDIIDDSNFIRFENTWKYVKIVWSRSIDRGEWTSIHRIANTLDKCYSRRNDTFTD